MVRIQRFYESLEGALSDGMLNYIISYFREKTSQKQVKKYTFNASSERPIGPTERLLLFKYALEWNLVAHTMYQYSPCQ